MFDSDANALVNTVNCVGVMGKGVALEFKKRWPENFKFYKKACENKTLRPGVVLVFDRGGLFGDGGPRYLVNFPTKDHWRAKSKISFIKNGLESMVDEIVSLGIKSVALPPLGCGNGGLDWDEVRPIIISSLDRLTDVDIQIYGPAPERSGPEYLEVASEMTRERALYLKAIASLEDRFGGIIDRLSLQKIAYFLQILGVRLNLKFDDTLYGPYSETLKRALFKFNKWNYVEGFSGGRCVTVTKAGFAAADEYLRSEDESDQLIKKLAHLFLGYENPYGLELLATTHFHAASDGALKNLSLLTEEIHSFGSYRRNSFPEPEIVSAYERLVEDGLL
jgi:O-acetyl-ADP-ribose deacetylase (regulator of RNase III)